MASGSCKPIDSNTIGLGLESLHFRQVPGDVSAAGPRTTLGSRAREELLQKRTKMHGQDYSEQHCSLYLQSGNNPVTISNRI